MTRRHAAAELGDDWFASEESPRVGLVTELQRIRRRARVRWVSVLLLAGAITTAATYKFATKPHLVEAEVVLALTEGAFAAQHTGVPADQLREYVNTILLPDKQLIALIERRDLYPLRKQAGPQFAISSLRDQLDIAIWKNSFLTYDAADSNARKSARIGITVADTDPDRAFTLAEDLASIAIVQHELERERISRSVAQEVALMRKTLEDRLSRLDRTLAQKQSAYERARTAGDNAVAAQLVLDRAALSAERKSAADQQLAISQSREGIADQIAAAGLDLSLGIVEERRPDRPERAAFVLILVVVVVGTGSLIGAAMVIGAFDSRIHDTDDVARLGLPVLGHVPGFAGDTVGSLRSRGARRPRVGSVLRWRSLR